MLRRNWSVIACVVFLVVIVTFSNGCARLLGNAMVRTPFQVNPFASQASLSPPARDLLGIDQQFRVDVGPPEASLSVSVIDPESGDPPRGTVLVLHGIWNSSFWMLGTARMLSEDGYRAVLVDLRGHGRSSGEWLTYGVCEAQDISQVIDVLEERDLIAGALGVYGISYGATTSIHLAGGDTRIASVVAVAPFSTMRDVVNDYARTALPGIEQVIDDDTFDQAVDEAGEVADFDPAVASAINAIKRTKANVLIVHGTDDWLIPSYHAVRLYEAGRGHTELVLVPRTGHIKIWFDPTGEVAHQTRRWFEKTL
jgi:pimeloyl-ACP methyl ester carboxylesterase